MMPIGLTRARCWSPEAGFLIMTESDRTLPPDGYLGAEEGVERLLSDLGVMSEDGIERAAWGWTHHVGQAGVERFREAERAAIRILEADDRGEQWDSLRQRILDLTEGRGSLVAWRTAHGPLGHDAEQAAMGAGLALLAGAALGPEDQTALLLPLDEALPWLLPEVPPKPAP
jgi:hypothetical protein